MPDPIENNNNNNQQGGGNDPKQNVAPFDPAKIGDEDFNKIFEDPRLYKHSRFSNLRERAKKADEYEQEKSQAEEKRLLEEKKYQELAEKAQKERDDAHTRYQTAVIDNKIQIEASKQGAVDLEAVLKLIDRSGISLNDEGSAQGVAEAVKSLLETKAYLKGKSGSVTIGSETNPGTGSGEGKFKFKLSQLQNAQFYQEHNTKGEVDEAFRLGQVENDLPH